MFCQQRKNVNAASSNKGICRNPITGLWEENSSAGGQKKKGGGEMVAVLVITLCSVKWKGIQVQQVLLAVIRDGGQAVLKGKCFRL